MTSSLNQSLSVIFADTLLHKTVREIIEQHSSNKMDVRAFALDGLQLLSSQTILDLGCGFGFFSRALNDKIPSDATILGIDRLPGYRSLFLNSCNYLGIKGIFNGSGINSLQSLPSDHFNLVLCSYAIYFFPEIIPEIARILKPGGTFVIITHNDKHAHECIDLVKETVKQMGIQSPKSFPHNKLINRFSNRNGNELLSPWFAEIKEKKYTNSLHFNTGDLAKLKVYFDFKKPYYFPFKEQTRDEIFNKMISKLKEDLQKGLQFSITKNDTVFICRKPFRNNE